MSRNHLRARLARLEQARAPAGQPGQINWDALANGRAEEWYASLPEGVYPPPPPPNGLETLYRLEAELAALPAPPSGFVEVLPAAPAPADRSPVPCSQLPLAQTPSDGEPTDVHAD